MRSPRQSPIAPARVPAAARHLRAVLLAATLLVAGLVAPAGAFAAFGEISRFGNFGTGNGQLPGVVFDAASDATNGRLYVPAQPYADDGSGFTGANAIVVYGADGSFVQKVAYPTDPGVLLRVAVDGPRKRLYVLRYDAATTESSVQWLSLDDLGGAPHDLIPASDADLGGLTIAVDQSPTGPNAGRVFVGYNAVFVASAQGLDPQADAGFLYAKSGYVREYSAAGAPVRTLGKGQFFDDPSKAPAGTFFDGDVSDLTVEPGTGDLLVADPAHLARFSPAGTLGAGFNSVDSVALRFGFSRLSNGTFLTPGDSTGAALVAADGKSVQTFGHPTATYPAPKCGWLTNSVTTVPGLGGDVYVISSDVDFADTSQPFHTSIVRLGPGGSDCGFADPVIDAFTASNAQPSVGDTVTLSATGSIKGGGALTYAWDLDGDAATGPGGFEVSGGTTQSVTITKKGTLTVRVRVTDSTGTSVIRSLPITTKTNAPQAALSLSATTVGVGGSVTLDAGASVAGDDPITHYEWDLGSGTFDTDGGTSPRITKTFPAAGTFRVRVKITAGALTSVSGSQTVTVSAPAGRTPTPAAKPAPTPTPGPKLSESLVPLPTVGTALKGSVKKGLSVAVACGAGGQACDGKLTLQSAGKKPVSLAKGTYSVKAGEKATVKLKLTKAGKKALKRAKKAKGTLLVAATGGQATKTSVKLTLR